MTATVLRVPIGGNKLQIEVTQGVTQAATIDAAIPAGFIGLVIDENLIDLETIQSGRVYVPAIGLGERMIESSGAYSAMADTAAYSTERGLYGNVAQINTQVIASPSVITLNLLFVSGYVMAFIVNRPPVSKRGSEFITSANQMLADALRELVP